jgi:hypothetical protein
MQKSLDLPFSEEALGAANAPNVSPKVSVEDCVVSGSISSLSVDGGPMSNQSSSKISARAKTFFLTLFAQESNWNADLEEKFQSYVSDENLSVNCVSQQGSTAFMTASGRLGGGIATPDHLRLALDICETSIRKPAMSDTSIQNSLVPYPEVSPDANHSFVDPNLVKSLFEHEHDVPLSMTKHGIYASVERAVSGTCGRTRLRT